VTLVPTAPAERLESIDILRGLALFGVLLENMQHFVSPTYAAFVASPEAGLLDRAALSMIRFTCDNKVYLLFSFLFGYGIAMQLSRAAARDAPVIGIHLWRMAILLLIGLAHMLVWTGDILSTFAVLGALLLLLRGASDRALGATCLAFLAAPSLALALLAGWAGLAQLPPEARQAIEMDVALLDYPIRQSCFAFAMFALGLAAGRANRLADSQEFVGSTRRLLGPALALGLAANLATALLVETHDGSQLSARAVLTEATIALGGPSLALCYVLATFWCLERPAWRVRLRPFAAVGRTTLTNYLLQSLIGVGILARTGLGPLGPITPPAGIVLTCVLFGLQMAASRWWLARFRFGPVEWLWRSLAYGERQPLRGH
jgi:uncharacterized protein